jgi:hypothetical protein
MVKAKVGLSDSLAETIESKDGTGEWQDPEEIRPELIVWRLLK